MSEHEVSTRDEIDALPTGQWVKAADGRIACLFDTHMGFPQRMWGLKADGGTKGYVNSYTHIHNLPSPLHLCDIVTSVECEHRHTNECGQCKACGVAEVGESRPTHFDADDLAVFQAIAEHNTRLEGSIHQPAKETKA